MKKIFGLSIVIGALLFSLSTYAAPEKTPVVEVPETKIIIEGEELISDDKPVNKDSRLLLPFRVLLNSLGVSNENIQWIPSTKTISVNTTDSAILLQIGNNVASVNGKTITMDVPAVIYKDRTYVPLRFITQSLNKTVHWDAKLSSAFINNEVNLAKIKSVLAEVYSNTESNLNSARILFELSSSTKTKSGQLSQTVFNGTSDFDKDSQFMHTFLKVNFTGAEKEYEIIQKGRKSYIYNDESKIWEEKNTSKNTIDNNLIGVGDYNLLNIITSQTLENGLSITESDNEIILKGAVLANRITPFITKDDSNITKYNSFNTKLVIDKSKMFFTNITLEAVADLVMKNEPINIFVIAEYNIEKHNEKFEMNIPVD
jgi:hypothetical protein